MRPFAPLHAVTRFARLRVATRLATCALTFLPPTLSAAQVARPIGLGARAAGMGDTGRASALGHDAMTLNPAAMSQAMVYEFHAGYAYSGQVESHIPSVSIVDSATNPYFSLGVGYSYLNAGGMGDAGPSDVTGDRQGHQVRVAASTGYQSDIISIYAGMGFRWLSMDVSKGSSGDYYGLDAGVLLGVSNLIRLAVVGHNLVESDGYFDSPRSIGTGVSIVYDAFLAEFDAVADFDTRENTRLKYQVGMQYVLLDAVPLRAGFVADRVSERNLVTGGVGFWTPAFSMDVGYQHNVEEKSDFYVGVDFKVYIP